MNKSNKYKLIINGIAIISTIITIVFYIIYKQNNNGIFKTLAITFLTISFHFDIRLLIGLIVLLFKKNVNILNRYYRLSEFEKRLYNKIKVKKWKSKTPTYRPEDFHIKKDSLEDIAKNMCISEIVHTLNVFVSYIPCLFIIIFGTPFVFILTSFFASIYDLKFVIIQRYNRQRIINILNK